MASKAGQPAKPKAYPAPSREAWKDLRYQLQSLRKAGKGANLNAQWDKAKSQSDKRTFYYEVFLLDPQVSQKEVHKESLQKHTSLQKAVSGWMTMWEIGKLEGADPSLPSFESLCKAAVDGLPSRSHEVAAWAKQGIKQYWYCKELHKETATKHTSSTKTSEKVAELEDEPFRKVEEALRVSNEGPQTLMLGNKAGRPGSSKDGQQQVQEDEASEEKQPEEGAWIRHLPRFGRTRNMRCRRPSCRSCSLQARKSETSGTPLWPSGRRRGPWLLVLKTRPRRSRR